MFLAHVVKKITHASANSYVKSSDFSVLLTALCAGSYNVLGK